MCTYRSVIHDFWKSWINLNRRSNPEGPMRLVLDIRIDHDRVGSSADPTLNGHLRYPNNLLSNRQSERRTTQTPILESSSVTHIRETTDTKLEFCRDSSSPYPCDQRVLRPPIWHCPLPPFSNPITDTRVQPVEAPTATMYKNTNCVVVLNVSG
jgi:hypothetical protein